MTNNKSNKTLEFEVFKLEYNNLYESYRHTYATIWQAGGVFTAISAALLGISAFSSESIGNEFIVEWIWPIPYLLWWIAIFTPMDRYGKLRFQRLKELEELTHQKKWGHKMKVLKYSELLKEKQKIVSLRNFRVGVGIDIFSIIIILIWIYFLLWKYIFN